MFGCSPFRSAASLAIVVCGVFGSARTGDGQQRSECDAAGGLAMLIETVTDRATRAPLAGATVIVTWRAGGERQARSVTDSTGTAIICAPPQLPLTIRVSYFDLKANDHATLTLGRVTTNTSIIDVPGAFVRGTVIDQVTGLPVPNVQVRIGQPRLSAVTNADGKFYFERVPLGDHTLRVEHISYAINNSPIVVREEDLDAVVRLTPAAIPLQPIVVTAFSRRLEHVGFYEREKRGVGTFISRRQIDAMNVQTASDLLRAVPSMRLVPQTPRRNAPRQSTTGRGNCRFRFIVDGTRTLADFEMDYVAPWAIEGVEVYKGLSEVPALFKAHASEPGATCGVIAIWTRDSR